VSGGGQIAYHYVEVCQHLVKCFGVFGYLNEVNSYGCVEMYQPFREAKKSCVFMCLINLQQIFEHVICALPLEIPVLRALVFHL